MHIHNGHPGYDKSKDEDADRHQKHGNYNLHPMREIALTGRQLPVKGNQTDVEPVDDNAEYGPRGGPFDELDILFAHTDGI